MSFTMKSLVNLREKSFCSPEISNPFVRELKLSAVDKLQVALMSVTVAPLRLLLITIIFLIMWSLAAVGVAFRSEEDSSKPLLGWRKHINKPYFAMWRAIFFIIGFHHVRTKGERAPANIAPLLVAAPHSSMFDTLLICVGTQPSSPVSRTENAQMPLFGTLLKFLQPVLVRREDPQSRIKAVREILNRSCSNGQWPQIIIFPEGTCTNRTCLISFKLGAFFPGVPVQPVCVKYPNKLDTVTWTWEGPSAFKLLWLTMCQFYTRCEIEEYPHHVGLRHLDVLYIVSHPASLPQYLPVYIPTEKEHQDPRLFANEVRAQMAFHLDLPVTDHTFDDCRLMQEARKLHLAPTAGLVEFEKLHSKLGVSFSGMQEILQHFNAIKGSRSKKEEVSSISYEDFKHYLMLPDSEALKEVFSLYDRDASGTIDFREYVIGLSLLSSPVNNDDTLELAFELFDLDGNRYISQEELAIILGRAFNVSKEETKILFTEVDANHDGKISLDEFKSYALKKPEYARIFTTYRELKLHQEQQQQLEQLDQHKPYDAEFEQWGIQVDAATKKLQ